MPSTRICGGSWHQQHFFIIGDELVTPPLGGTILPGITRDSVIQLARSWAHPVMERPVTMEEVIIASERGSSKGGLRVRNCSHRLAHRSDVLPRKEHKIGSGKTGSLTKRLYNEIYRSVRREGRPLRWRLKI